MVLRRTGGVGVISLELVGEVPAGLDPLGRVGLCERDRQPLVDGVTLGDGEVAGDVAALVEGAALHQRPITEHLANSGPQRLGAVDHDQDPVLEAQPASDQISEEVLHDDGVLGVTEHHPDRHLRPISGDHQGDDDHLIRDVEPVDHQHRRLQLRQVPREQLAQRSFGRGDEPS